jgi:hypothetical protein
MTERNTAGDQSARDDRDEPTANEPSDSDSAGIADCEECGDRLTAETMSYLFPELCIECAEEVDDDEEPSVGVTRMLEKEWYAAYQFRTSTVLIAFDARGDTIPEALRELADEIEGTEESA